MLEYGKEGYLEIDSVRNYLYIHFNSIPDTATRESLKVLKWHYNGSKRAWGHYNDPESYAIAKGLLGEKAKPTLTAPSDSVIGIEDIVVITSVAKCVYGEHELFSCNAWINVWDGKRMEEIAIPVIHCKQCGIFYLYTDAYEELKRKGYICTRIIERKEYIRMMIGEIEWSAVSLIGSYGYNTNSVDGLSDKRRHDILDFLIVNGIMSKAAVIDFLSWRIRLGMNRKKLAVSVSKLKNDREYVVNSLGKENDIAVRSIFCTKKIKCFNVEG